MNQAGTELTMNELGNSLGCRSVKKDPEEETAAKWRRNEDYMGRRVLVLQVAERRKSKAKKMDRLHKRRLGIEEIRGAKHE